jgi:hypothetical protein
MTDNHRYKSYPLRIDPKLKAKGERAARKDGVSFNVWVAGLIQEEIEYQRTLKNAVKELNLQRGTHNTLEVK